MLHFSDELSIKSISYKCYFHEFIYLSTKGEANSRAPDAYACQFPAMIDDWRSKFNAASQHQTDKQFPFGFVQVIIDRGEIYEEN